MLKKVTIGLAITMLFTNCSINNSIMLKTDKDYAYDPIDMTPSKEYHISNNDILKFRLFTNSGFELVEQSSNNNTNRAYVSQNERLSYLVEQDGYIKLPVLGRVKISGYSIREAEYRLEEMYTEYYNEPFVQLTVTNRRVIIFPGAGGAAKVVMLSNENTTLIEALAQAGGISERGRAGRIKLIREGDGSTERKVYLIDLSVIEGLKYGDLVVQANDIIYVEPVPDIAREVTKDIAPILSLLTTALFLYTVIKGFSTP